MKQAIIVFAAIVACVFAQAPANGNPAGAPYFSSSNTFYLPLNNTALSLATYDYPSDYATFLWGYIPETVGSVTFSLNVSDTCSSYIEAYLSFVEPEGDDSVGFFCSDSYYNCDYYDYSFYTYSSTYSTYDVSSSSFRPGYFYITVDSYYSQNCTYTFQASVGFSCPAGQIPANDDGTLICLSYKNVTTNGQNFAGFANYTAADTDVYRVNVPRNVSKVWVYAYSQSIDLGISAISGYASAYIYDDDYYTYTYQSYLASNNSIYTYYLEVPQPRGDTPLFFSVFSSTDDSAPYNISIYWTQCSASTSGLGEFSLNATVPSLVYQIPDCYAPVVYNDVSIAGSGSYVFNLAAYNSTSGRYGSQYAFLEVAAGTLGAVNFTCTTNGTTYNKIVFSKGQMSDCDGDYAESIYCDGTSAIRLLSQDLFVGGYWTIGACNDDATSASITVTVGGSVTAPSPSSQPGASASSSPGSGSSGQDSSSASGFLPALLLIALAILVQF